MGILDRFRNRRKVTAPDPNLREHGESVASPESIDPNDTDIVEGDWGIWKERTITHLREVTAQLNRLFEKLGIEIYVDATESIREVELSLGGYCPQTETFKKTSPKFFGPKSGILFENNIINLVERLLDKVLDDGRSINVLGATQSGKTTQNVAMLFLGPIIYVLTAADCLLTGQGMPLVYYPVLFTPNKISLHSESQIAIQNLFKLYGKLEFISTVSSVKITASQYLGKMRWRTNAVSPAGQVKAALSSYSNTVLEATAEELADGFAIQLSKKTSIAELRKVRKFLQDVLDTHITREDGTVTLKEVQDVQREFLLIFDECDHGDKQGQLTDQFLRMTLNYQGLTRTILEICSDENAYSRIINSSATMYAYFARKVKELLAEVRLKIGDGYYGFNISGGAEIDPDAKDVRAPHRLSASQFAEETGNDFFPFIRGVLFGCGGNLHGKMIARNWHKTDQWNMLQALTSKKYDLACIESLAHAIKWCLASNPGDNMVIRFSHKLRPTERMIDALNEAIKGVAYASVWSGSADPRTEGTAAKHLQKTRLEQGLPVVQFVVGKARRGDPYPASVRYFLDFTERAGSITILEQGLLGRACGYKKWDAQRINPITGEKGFGNLVVLNDDEYIEIERWIAKKGAFNSTTKHLSDNATADARPNPTYNYVVLRRGLSAEIDALITRLQPIVTGMVYPDRSSGTHEHPDNWVPQRISKTALKALNDVRIDKYGTVYIPVWTPGFDLTAHVASNPQISNALMPGVDSIRLFDYRDALNGTMRAERAPAQTACDCGEMHGKIVQGVDPYRLFDGDPTFADVTLHWAEGATPEERRSLKHIGHRDVRSRSQHARGPGGRRLLTHGEQVSCNIVRSKTPDYHEQYVVPKTEETYGKHWDEKHYWVLESIVVKCEKPAVADVESGVAWRKDCIPSGIAAAAGEL